MPRVKRGVTAKARHKKILAKAKGYTDHILHELRPPPGVDAYVSGQAAIQHDLDPIFSRDLKKGESIAIPIALAVLLAVFGLSFAATVPFLFAAATITGTCTLTLDAVPPDPDQINVFFDQAVLPQGGQDGLEHAVQ